MNDSDFDLLCKSIRQAGEIKRGVRKPSRTFVHEDPDPQAIRERLGLSQSRFAAIIGVSVRTLTRDIQILREQGLPIDADRGRGGGLRMPVHLHAEGAFDYVVLLPEEPAWIWHAPTERGLDLAPAALAAAGGTGGGAPSGDGVPLLLLAAAGESHNSQLSTPPESSKLLYGPRCAKS